MDQWRHLQHQEHYNEAVAETYFLWFALNIYRNDRDLNLVFDQDSYGLIAVGATHGE